jgi:Mycobacterium membrane protein
MNPWRARCGEIRSAGSEGGPGKRIGRNADTAPWSDPYTRTQPAVFANVVAQGDSASIGCRITIDGVVKDERSVNTVNAYTFCLDKSG